MIEHEFIWLQPMCPECQQTEDRTWCQDNVWSDGCDACGAKPVKYKIVKRQSKVAHSSGFSK